jgi:hypothetical protein
MKPITKKDVEEFVTTHTINAVEEANGCLTYYDNNQLNSYKLRAFGLKLEDTKGCYSCSCSYPKIPAGNLALTNYLICVLTKTNDAMLYLDE